MGHNLATWKLLEDLMLEVKKIGTPIPQKVIEDLRAAKSMIELSCVDGSRGEALQKVEEYLANVEAYVVTEGQKAFGSDCVDGWLRRIEEANAEVCEEGAVADKFVTGVPRDQKWVRIEPMADFSAERIGQMAKEQSLQVKPQTDGKLVVYGQPENLKLLLKKMAPQKTSG